MASLNRQVQKKQNAVKKRLTEREKGMPDRNKPKKIISAGRLSNKRDFVLPTYGTDGKVKAPEKEKRIRRVCIGFATVAMVVGFLYLPQFLIPAEHTEPEGIMVETDFEAVAMSNKVLRDNASEDFDGDGIMNADETAQGTDPWNMDTDLDSVTDYAELHITNTSPTENTFVMRDVQIRQDKADEKSLANPYSISGVVMWPDDYESKAYGSVVKNAAGGYRFCNFTGNVLFPDSDGLYAYRYEDGIHTLLVHDPSDNTWHVESGDYVELFNEELEETVRVSLFGLNFYMDEGTMADMFCVILPERGFLTAVRMCVIDTEPDTSPVVQNEIARPVFQENSADRLMKNTNSLTSLGLLKQALDEGKCAAVSFYNSSCGEYLAIVYGYRNGDTYLLADMETLEPAGELEVKERARKILNEEGEVISVQYFKWNALGFTDDNRDRISIFAFS